MGKTILLIDDNALFLSMMGRILEAAGYQILLAEDGAKGFSLFLERHPDLIMIDLLMPKVTGAQLIQQIRRHPQGQAVPVIMMTAMLGSHALIADALQKWGVNVFLPKESDFSVVLEKVAELIGPAAPPAK